MVLVSAIHKGIPSCVFSRLECVDYLVLLCQAMWRPFMCGLAHVDCKCGHCVDYMAWAQRTICVGVC